MSTIVIPAREVKAGDVIDFGGLPFTVANVNVLETIGIWGRVGTWDGDESGISCVVARPDLPLNVQRPDPDAELVEVMARAAFLDDGCAESSWPTAPSREAYRGNARAALAAAREAGLL